MSKEKESQQKLNEANEQYLRLQAEFANFKRRTEEEKKGYVELGVAKALKYFINVFDDFELALKNKTENVEDYRKGMELLFAKFISTSEDLGLSRIKTKGEQFNPHFHEALLTENSKKPEQEILEELQAGYLFNNQTLRTAKVKVAKNNKK
jgi:molecular chaperone GrpE